MGTSPTQSPFAADGGTATLLFPAARDRDSIAVSFETVQQIIAYTAEKEQTLADLHDRIAELQRQLQTDELTGLLNRRGFEVATRRVLSGAARYRETGVLAVIDIDGFKRVNDKHGHAAGDAALKLVGRILNDNIRATDYAARLGGDEFAVLWVRATPAALAQRFRDLKQSLNAAELSWKGIKIALKASAGAAAFDQTATLEDLMRRADKAMYRQKRARQKA